MFRFVHAADLHIDSPLRGLERYPGAPVEDIRGAAREALKQLVTLAIEEEVAFVLLAGDTFDGDWKDYKTGLFFAEQMARLQKVGISVLRVLGNHDTANRGMKKLRMPANVRELSSQGPETARLEELEVAVHGQSFAARTVPENLARGFPERVRGWLNIGLLHTSLDGREGHADYAPCTVADLRAHGYDYWALGHVHRREVVGAGDPWIVYPGNLQGRHARETGSKGCTLVTVEEGSIAAVEHVELCVLRWERVEVDAAGAADGQEVTDRAKAGIEAALERAEGLPVAARVELRGACPAHAEIVSDPERWIQEIRGRGLDANGEVWVEKVVFGTRPVVDLAAAVGRQDALGELLRFVEEVSQSPEALDDLAEQLGDLAKKIPRELREGPDPLRIDDPERLRAEVGRARDLLLARLAGGGVA